MTPAGEAAVAHLPALRRIAAAARLGEEERERLRSALRRARVVRQRRELLVEGQPVPAPLILVEGWAARVRLLADGRRQFVSFVLPGDLVGTARRRTPLAIATVVALTDVLVCAAPAGEPGGELEQAYAVIDALDEAYLCAHVVRLGRLTAQERIGDLLLEFHERLARVGQVAQDRFEVPLTQEMIGDALGLTSVHVNRMLQQARRDGTILWDRGRITLPDIAGLAAQIGRRSPTVTSEG